MVKEADVIDINEGRLVAEIQKLAKDKDIIAFAKWVNDNVVDEFLIKTDRKQQKKSKPDVC